jgi:DNA replication protein DnaC
MLPRRHTQNARKATASKHKEWQYLLATLYGSLGTGTIRALLGGRGTGKTQAAVILCMHAESKGMRTDFMNAYGMFAEIRKTFDGDGSHSGAVRKLCLPNVLVIDELNEIKGSTWERQTLSHIVDVRYQRMLDTVLISNHTPGEFRDAVGESIVDRIRETGGLHECSWSSFRKAKGGAQ